MFLVLASPPAATTFHNSIISPSLAVGLGAERRLLAQLQLLLRGTENGTRSKEMKKKNTATLREYRTTLLLDQRVADCGLRQGHRETQCKKRFE